MPIFPIITGTISKTISSVVQVIADAYPLAGRVLDLFSFTSDSKTANDISGENNNAILYSGRGVSLDGVGDSVLVPLVGSVSYVKLLAKSSTDTSFLATDTLNSILTASIVANDTWQEITISNPVGDITLGKLSSGTHFTGEIAYLRSYDSGDNLLDEAYLNEHTDETANGLNGKALVTRNGNIGSYSGCAAVVQEGINAGLSGVSGYNDKLFFDGTNKVTFGSVPDYASKTMTFSFLYTSKEGQLITLCNGSSYNLGVTVNSTFDENNEFIISSDNSGAAQDGRSFRYNGLVKGTVYTVSVSFDSNYQIVGGTIGGEPLTETLVGSSRFDRDETEFALGIREDGLFPYNGLIFDFSISSEVAFLGYGSTPWEDTIGTNDGTESGTFATVAQERTMSPQVLGMDFNLYPSFDNTHYIVTSSGKNLNSEATTIQMTVIPSSGTDGPLFAQQDGTGTGRSILKPEKAQKQFVSFFGGTEITHSYVYEYGEPCEITMVIDGTNLDWTINGDTDSFTIVQDNATGPFVIGSNKTLVNPLDGPTYIYNISVSGSFTYSGAGSSAWNDTSGNSNNGTETILSAYDSLLVNTSLSNSANDALGNPIADPRGSKTFNSDGNGYAEVLDSDSLDLTTAATWVLKGNFYGTPNSNQSLLSKFYNTGNEKSWLLQKKSGGAAASFRFFLSADGASTDIDTFTGLTDETGYLIVTYDAGDVSVYWRGSLIDSSVNTVTSIYQSTADVGIGCELNSTGAEEISSFPVDEVKIYNRVLTSEEIATFN